MAREQLLGFKHSQGEFDGTRYNKLTLFFVAKMEQTDSQRGSAGYEQQADVALVDSLKKIVFNSPVEVEVESEKRATGKGMFKDVIVSVRPTKAAAVI